MSCFFWLLLSSLKWNGVMVLRVAVIQFILPELLELKQSNHQRSNMHDLNETREMMVKNKLKKLYNLNFFALEM